MTHLRMAAAFAGALAFTISAAQADTLRLSHNTGDQTTWQKGADRFAELVEEGSGGETSIRVFPNAQLTGGDQMKQAEMVGRGSIDFVVTSAINVTPLVPEMAVFSLPYLYANYDQVDATTGGAPGEKMAEILAEHGLHLLAWGENGFREVTNNKHPIKTPDDLKGLKMRVAGPMYIDVMNALGANPQQMQWTETFSALQQGVVDGQENPIGAVIIPQRVYEVQKYITPWHYSYDPIFIATSEKNWESWDDETRAMISGAAEEAMAYQREITREATADGLETLKAEGMEVYTPTDADLAAFRAATKAPFDTWAAKVGDDLVSLFQDTIAGASATQ
ncbi:DctP family TRAP transporter solute-binding subunit [Citreicella sp. C3M06]|uniref:DctP family TRAP transporter solute-binding subunit n=1 Tax=Roseobacteraceae TaxID=2854170 RepID=UPI001C094BD2|nr:MULTISPECIES: DctP family TRAP transporter solute-binding subunit [Roseobacteraceae]MBU2960355.1 DctP family TRAP transporter solute-binding subunit [Citreicella sp. C3M06]MDO6587992.1 DctP family TRAP transporter solute-binding subunit [Salipiger sp. 1_MG-2023]